MKFLTSQLMATLQQSEVRRNLRPLLKYVAFLVAVVLVFSVLFHVLMRYEGQKHTWLTGLYWTLTVMSTLGFGDITFESDLGRGFSMIVLMSGIILLLIVLPFAFIRYFYAPWLEARLRLRAPRMLPSDSRGHVVICRFDALAEGLVERLRMLSIPHVILEPDSERAASLHADDVRVVAGDPEASETYAAVQAAKARLVAANLDDAANTNVILTVRELAPDVPVVALADDEDAVDILQLSGATHVVPVKQRLGQQLAARVSAGEVRALVVGRLDDLLVAEFPVQGTPLAGKTIRDTRLREVTGANVVAYWERGQLQPAHPEAVLTDACVAVVIGAQEQLDALSSLFVTGEANKHPVIVIGGGKVGRATARALADRGIPVHILEKNDALRGTLERIAEQVTIGDAAELVSIRKAGIGVAPSVVLTTHDDATNIYLAVYCRRLNPDIRIVSRIMYDRNLEAIHRAGADFVLGETALAVRSIVSALLGRELVVIGETVDLFVVPVPSTLAGQTLADSDIGAKTGLNVIGVEQDGKTVGPVSASTSLEAGARLVMLGTNAQRQHLKRRFRV